MSDFSLSPDHLKPGSELLVGDFNAWHLLETDLSGIVDPTHIRAHWAGRLRMQTVYETALARNYPDLTVSDIGLVVIGQARAYDELQSAREQGWRFIRGGGAAIRRQGADREGFIGFDVFARVATRHRRDPQEGELESKVWYAPLPGKGRLTPNQRDPSGLGITRISTIPKINGLERAAKPKGAVSANCYRVTLNPRGNRGGRHHY